ncbi:TolC family protein [Calorimonas adulescens]|uniref:TolC family protein n=1 Tax=Calorimonas adulescens TaxID=2606906 RepID=A0A5D8QGD3_9THEO|nr:TolC family protein [Calorimonas adulescens]TZE82906.1 TolC family protein [Calorimonas adulescens]
MRGLKVVSLTMSVIMVGALLVPASGLAEEGSDTKSFTLEEAIDYALQNNDSLKNMDLQIEIMQNQYDQVEYRLKRQFDVKDLNDIPDSKAYKMGVSTYDADRQVLIAPKELKNGIDTLENTKKQLEEAIKLSVEQAYYKVLEDEQNLDVLNTSLELAQKAQSIAKVQFDKGMITEDQLLQAEIGVSGVNMQIDQAKATLEKDMLNLKRQLGLPLKSELKLETVFKVPDISGIDVEEGVESALKNRMEILEAKKDLDIKQQDFELIKKYYSDITFQYKSGLLNLNTSQEKLKSAEQDVELDVRSKYLDMKSASSALPVLQMNVEKAQESLRLAQLRFENGLGTIVDVLNAQNTLLQNQLDLVKTQHGLNLAKINYEVATGIGIPSQSQTSSSQVNETASNSLTASQTQ